MMFYETCHNTSSNTINDDRISDQPGNAEQDEKDCKLSVRTAQWTLKEDDYLCRFAFSFAAMFWSEHAFVLVYRNEVLDPRIVGAQASTSISCITIQLVKTSI